MTISQGGLIQAVDYNTLRTGVSNLLGVGSGDRGYGQTVAADTDVVAGTTVVSADPTTLKQWVALYGDMKKIADHQQTDITTLKNAYENNVKSGSLIQYSDINLMATTLATLDANRLNIGTASPVQYSDDPLVSSQRTQTVGGPWGAPNKTTVQHTFKITFTSSEAIRFFFNAGGKITFTASRLGGTVTTQNTEWTNLLSSMGTITVGQSSTTAGSGSPQVGFKDITTNTLVYYKGGYVNKATSDPGWTTYSNNDYNITATKDGANLTFNVYFNDDGKSKDPNQYGTYDVVDGTLTSVIRILRPSGSNVSLPSPTVINLAELSA